DTTAITPAAWSWQPAAPRDTAPRGDWWTVFRDADLNNLEGRALAGSQTLKAGVARVLQARANARAEATGYFPDIRLHSSAQRERREAADTLALLCGEPASHFDLPERPLNLAPPAIPAGIPAHVLERRPDVAAAERDVAAKNAQIGVAQAAYFPAISLTGSSG